jgi:CelD/BcsL family acetyltransferase involved in cellulose biosynthesis
MGMSLLYSETGAQAVSRAGKTSLTVRVCRTWSELEELRPAWNRLLQSCLQPSIFQTPEWLTSWWHSFGANKELLTLVFHNDDENIVALAPMYAEEQRFCGLSLRVLRLVGAGSGDSDALDFIVAPGYEKICAQTFLAWLTQEHICDICALETLPQNSPIAQHIAGSARRSGLELYSQTSPNFFIDLPSTWPAYLEILEPNFRPLLTRYPKRLYSRFNVSITRCERESDLVSSLEALFALHQMRWTTRGEPGAFSSAERRDFYLRMAHAFQSRGWLEFWLLKIEDEITAAQFCFRYGNTVSLLQEGFHPKYAAEKVGYALRAQVLQQMIQAGATRYDFLGGTDAYKLKFGARCGSYLTLQLTGTLRGRIFLAAGHRKQQIKQWLKRKLPAFVLAAFSRGKVKAPAGTASESME